MLFRRGLTTPLLTLLLCVFGCQSYQDPHVPVPIRPFVEPEFQQRYLLYRPSNYDRGLSWPLVVVCADAFPDSPDLQIHDWTQIAERNGFLVVAPTLSGKRLGLFPSGGETTAPLAVDERRILATVRHVQAAHTVSEDRIFIYGWAGGAQTALFTGLRHPEVFRAIAVFQPRIEVQALTEASRSVDASQAVLVFTNSADAIWGHPAAECLQWLRKSGVDVTEDPLGPARRTDGARAVDFFDRTIRNRPWIQIEKSWPNVANPAELRLAVRASFTPQSIRWRFGDGAEANGSETVHVYSKLGTYRVEVELRDEQGKTHGRATAITVRP